MCGNPGKMDENETCKISNCNRLVLNDQEGVQCDICDNWFHRTCVEISKEEYKLQKKNESSQWFCGKCLDEVRELKKELKVWKYENAELRKANINLEEVVKNLNAKMKDMIRDLKKEITDELKHELDEIKNDNRLIVL